MGDRHPLGNRVDRGEVPLLRRITEGSQVPE